MRDEIMKSLENEQERKKIIAKVDRVKMDEIASTACDEMNGSQGISNIQKAFKKKVDPNHYDNGCRIC